MMGYWWPDGLVKRWPSSEIDNGSRVSGQKKSDKAILSVP
jgi:hypothetical protein